VWERLALLGSPGAENHKVQAPRLLVVLAHPDDEVLALGGRMDWLKDTRFVAVTDGVPLDGADARAHGFKSLAEYGAARRAELNAALRLAGLNPACATGLRLASRGEVSDQRAAFSLVEISRALACEISQSKPEAVLTHPYEGGHPDHDACALAVSAAMRLSGFTCPVIEAPFYHAREGGMRTGAFLSGDAGVESRLTQQQKENKRARLACFASQSETLALFDIGTERFREAPLYDFSQRPTAEVLYYERYPWCMDGDKFCALAVAARRELGL
jgi:LmbE family N-acetylglucosaminyl deacetylase